MKISTKVLENLPEPHAFLLEKKKSVKSYTPLDGKYKLLRKTSKTELQGPFRLNMNA